MNNFEKWKETLTAEALYKLLDCAQNNTDGQKLNCIVCPAKPDTNSALGKCQPSCREHFFAWATSDPPKNKPPKARKIPHYLVFDRRTNKLAGCTTIRVDALLSKLTQKVYREVECGPVCPLHEGNCQKQKKKESEKAAK